MIQRLRAEIENVKKQVGGQWILVPRGTGGGGGAGGEDCRAPGLEWTSGVISGSTGLQGVQRPSQSRGLVIYRANISVNEDKIELLGSGVAWLENACYGISYCKTQKVWNPPPRLISSPASPCPRMPTCRRPSLRPSSAGSWLSRTPTPSSKSCRLPYSRPRMTWPGC